MKTIISILLPFIVNLSCIAQAPSILWEKTFGGSDYDEGFSILTNSNGDILTAGYSSSNNGDITNHYGAMGSPDFWIIKTDYAGNLIWSKNFGGTFGDYAHSIQKTFNGGYIICGETYSDTISRYHSALHDYDVLITKIDSNANFEWQKCYGGYYTDKGIQIQQTMDSGFVFLAEINNSGGDITSFYGQIDFWVVKIDAQGNIQWNKSLGGTQFDSPKSICVLSDGSILVTGVNGSSDGTITCGAIDYSAWVTKLDISGNILWDKCYGGSAPEIGYGVIESTNSGFYLCSSTDSNDGDVLGHINGTDIWVLKADSSGNIEWSNCFGGNGTDRPQSIKKTSDGGVIVTGRSNSNLAHPSNYDFIAVKVDSLGSLQWQGYYGGNGLDEGYDAVETPDGNFVVTGSTESSDGDITSNHGLKDLWLVKLENPNSISNAPSTSNQVYATINNGELVIDLLNNRDLPIDFSLYDISGKLQFSAEPNELYSNGKFNFNVNLPRGIYMLNIRFKDKNISKKIF